MTHVTYPDLLTHLTHDPLTDCQLWSSLDLKSPDLNVNDHFYVVVFHAKNFCTIGKIIPVQLVENQPKSRFHGRGIFVKFAVSVKKAHSVKCLIFL